MEPIICTYCGGSISYRRIENGHIMHTEGGLMHWNCDDAAYEEEIYMEEITLDQIWTIFNEANPDSEYMLSTHDEDKIHEALREYAKAKNITRRDTISSNAGKVNLRTTNDVTFLYDIYEITEVIEYNEDKSKTPLVGQQYRARPEVIEELGLLIHDHNLLGYRFIVNGKLIQKRDTWEEYLRGVDKEDLVDWDKPFYEIEMNKLK